MPLILRFVPPPPVLLSIYSFISSGHGHLFVSSLNEIKPFATKFLVAKLGYRFYIDQTHLVIHLHGPLRIHIIFANTSRAFPLQFGSIL
ncbi:hypothetical protein L1887_06417 [Cichorium endivia]|nr:hypothetical protein L1887_06417 [Cichorium endivia]